MTVNVRLFAILRDRARAAEVRLELPGGARVSDASVALGQKFPDLLALLTRVAYAVNQEYVDPSTLLKDGDELAVIPPVSGG